MRTCGSNFKAAGFWCLGCLAGSSSRLTGSFFSSSQSNPRPIEVTPQLRTLGALYKSLCGCAGGDQSEPSKARVEDVESMQGEVDTAADDCEALGQAARSEQGLHSAYTGPIGPRAPQDFGEKLNRDLPGLGHGCTLVHRHNVQRGRHYCEPSLGSARFFSI